MWTYPSRNFVLAQVKQNGRGQNLQLLATGRLKMLFFPCFSENPETPPSLFEQSESLHQDLRTKSSFWPLPFGTGREPEKAEELSYRSRLHRRRVHQSSPRVVSMRRALLRPTNMHPGISMTRLLVAKSHLPHWVLRWQAPFVIMLRPPMRHRNLGA